MLVTKESHLYIKPDNPSLATITRTIVDAGALEEAIPGCIGWGSWGAAEDLGGIRVGGKVVISHLQRQWQALETWQRLTGSKRAAGQCPIVGSLERLLMASGCLEAKVRLNLGPRQRCYGVWTAEARLAFEARAPDAGSVGPAAEKLCQSLTQLVIRRLNDSNGPTNRAVATLDQASMLHILEQDSFPGLKAPKSERALLRMAVDWSSQPWRSKEAVEAVMAKIKFAGAPACFKWPCPPLWTGACAWSLRVAAPCRVLPFSCRPADAYPPASRFISDPSSNQHHPGRPATAAGG